MQEMTAVEINFIWLGGKKLPDAQEKNFKKLIENNKPPSVINVWTDNDSRPNFEALLATYKAQGLSFNVKEINSLRDAQTVSTFECIDTLFRPNNYYSAMGDYFKAIIVGRPLMKGDVPFRLYTEFDDSHPETGFASILSALEHIPPIMWRFNEEAIEPDFLAINMASPVGQLSAQYLVSFTEKICALKKSNETDKLVFVDNGADPHVIRRYVGEHLNYALTGLKHSMKKTEEFKGGFDFGYKNPLESISKRKQGDDQDPSSWESVMKVRDESKIMHLNSPELRAFFYHQKLLAPYSIVIKEMETFSTDYFTLQKKEPTSLTSSYISGTSPAPHYGLGAVSSKEPNEKVVNPLTKGSSPK
ncbi:MAG TPA: hypothetical protein VGV92_03925 [Gammaproteobacteria bacterium]|nr:hypothetical protein [Gammaproteobacteria bacterium]